MSQPDNTNLPSKGQFLVYQADDGQLKIDVRLEGETAWLTQAHMASLFQTTVPNVNMHLRNIFEEGELQIDSVIQEFLITAADGKNYRTNHYNLDAVISVGYRVKSAIATRFRIWATQKLREYIVPKDVFPIVLSALLPIQFKFRKKLLSFKFCVPSLSEQKRIAGICRPMTN